MKPCLICQKQQTTIIPCHNKIRNFANQIEVCQNKECSRHLNLSMVRNWTNNLQPESKVVSVEKPSIKKQKKPKEGYQFGNARKRKKYA